MFKQIVTGTIAIFGVLIIDFAFSPSYATSDVSSLAKQAPNLNTKVISLALTAYKKAEHKGYSNSPILTVVDYALPSNKKRLWVFDVKKHKLLYHTYVAQGRGTGIKWARRFSNQPGTRESSLGLYKTDQTYFGHNGYSLKLTGLDQGFNNNAYRRSIVMHGAWYMSPQYIKNRGRAGLSFGCFAVSKKLAKPIINTIKNDTLIFAYYPNKNWIQHSKFL